MYDNTRFLELYSKIYKNNIRVMNGYSNLIKGMNSKQSLPLNVINYLEITELLLKLQKKISGNSGKVYSFLDFLFNEHLRIATNIKSRAFGVRENPIYLEKKNDKRFHNKNWHKNIVFEYILQSYICNSKNTKKFLNELLSDEDEQAVQKINFFIQQIIDALSPTNFVATNPEVINEALKTKGESLLKGYDNFVKSLEDSKFFLNLKNTDSDHFQVGKNIAFTKGKVVHKNDLMELIQYEPVCKEVHAKPLLIVPAWINKFYILDLSEKNSLIRWLLENGFTVFMISWCNSDDSTKDKLFEDYMIEGPLEALDVIENITGSKEISAMGYCLGGTLLAITLAYMKVKKDKRIKMASFLTTMTDFSYVGAISCFLSEATVSAVEENMEKTGYFEGSQMNVVFSLLKSNDLIWSSFINNCLLGREPLPFDILYWNSDNTRIPSKVHSFYLRNMYLYNNIVKPGKISLAGVPIDLSKIDIPTYILSTKEDHIAPWQTVYKNTNIFKGKSRFVLAGSGHVAGIVNHPDRKKYCFWVNDKLDGNNPVFADEWLENSEQREGSWWVDWKKWSIKNSGKKIPAVKVGSEKYKPIEDAPGSYVKVKCN